MVWEYGIDPMYQLWNIARTERLIDDRALLMNSRVTKEKETNGKDVEEPGPEM